MRFNGRTVLPLVQQILAQHHPMTLRQIHYRLVSVQATDNTSQHYDSLSKCLIRARQNGDIPWEWMEDRLRYPRGVSMWADPAEFLTEAAQWYRRDVWVTQPRYLEFWVLAPYGVTFNVGAAMIAGLPSRSSQNACCGIRIVIR
jgi:hypothetical protein